MIDQEIAKPQEPFDSWGCVVLFAPRYKPAQHTHRLFIARIHQVGNRAFDVIAFAFLMKLAIAAALRARLTEAMTIRTLGFHRQDRTIRRLRYINLVNDLDLR